MLIIFIYYIICYIIIMEDKIDKYDKLFKIVLVGDSGVGKSNILSRYINDEFYHESKSTIGVEFCTRTLFIDDFVIKIQIWDTAGQERFRAITKAYYRGSHGIIVVYDITSRKSFDNIIKWMFEFEENVDKTSVVLLVGNKCDLVKNREVSYEEGQEFANKNNFLFIETSALNGNNVENAFVSLIKNIIENHDVLLDNNSDIENCNNNDFVSQTITLDKSLYNKTKLNNNKKCC